MALAAGVRRAEEPAAPVGLLALVAVGSLLVIRVVVDLADSKGTVRFPAPWRLGPRRLPISYPGGNRPEG